MITWKKDFIGREYHKDGEPDWILIDDSNGDEIANLTVIENEETCTVEVLCEKIGYTCRFENLDKDKLGIIVPSLKRTVKYELFKFVNDFKKPETRKVYDLIEGLPLWKHLKNGSSENRIKLIGKDYGMFAEILGKRVLKDNLQRLELITNLFSGIKVLRVRTVKRKKNKDLVRTRIRYGYGDTFLEVDYQDEDGKHGKKVVIVEIKHGKIMIEQRQIHNYASMILHPEEHFRKVDEVKVVYMMFDDINTRKAYASYSTQELDRAFAKLILERAPIEKLPVTFELMEEGLPGLIDMHG